MANKVWYRRHPAAAIPCVFCGGRMPPIQQTGNLFVDACFLTEPTSNIPDTVLNVPAGMHRILNRDIAAAGIPKRDADGCVVHVHALRHSFGTHLSASGVAPRTAQAVMRHSNLNLTMNTYTDARLLDVASAVESIGVFKQHAPGLAPTSGFTGQMESIPDHSGDLTLRVKTQKNPVKPKESLGFRMSG